MGNQVTGPKGANAGGGLNDQQGKATAGLKAPIVQITAKHVSNAIGQVTQHLGKNPQNAPTRRQNPPPTQPQNQTNRTEPRRQETNRSENNRSSNHDRDNNNRTNNNRTDNDRTNNDRTNNDRTTPNRTDNQTGPQRTTPQRETSDPKSNSVDPKNNNFEPKTDNNQRSDNNRTPTRQNDFEPNTRSSNNYSSSNNGPQNQSNGLLRTTLSQLFQKSDVYLNTNTLNVLTAPKSTVMPATNNQISLPPVVTDLVQNLTGNLTAILGNTSQTSNQVVAQAVTQISTEMSREIQAVKDFLTSNPVFDAKPFVNLEIGERMSTAVETMLRYLPESIIANLQTHSVEEILNGLLLAQGVLVPQEGPREVINILDPALPGMPELPDLPNNLSMTDLRDLGRLVRILIADAGGAKAFGDLDLAVQKFIKILAANNEFGVFLAAVKIAGQPENNVLSRSLAVVQIYDFINRLLEAGEKAMKQTMNETASKNVLQKDAKENFLSVTVRDKDEKSVSLRSTGSNGAESSLRQFLEFNPNMAHDKSVSAFINPDDARSAQRDFSNMFQREIEDWLKSGNHRFVKDYDLEKPIGIVVERRQDGFFNASQMRLVLVRDGSVEGWHFMKSFLVR